MGKKIYAFLFALIAIAGMFSLGGCASERNPDDSQLPWSRPADWEGSAPFTGAKTRD